MGCIIPGKNGFFKELASFVLQTEAIDCPEKHIPLRPEWNLPLFDTAHIENSYSYVSNSCPKKCLAPDCGQNFAKWCNFFGKEIINNMYKKVLYGGF